MGLVLVVSALVGAMWFFFVLVHLGALGFFKKGERLILLLMMVTGPLMLWRIMNSIAVSGQPAPILLKKAALFLYWAGCIGYMEILSLLSRGISFRILLDLVEKKGTEDLAQLKSSYGGGMGLRGLLAKRLKSLSRIGLLRFDNNRVGPLSCSGWLFALVTSGMRRLLRLQEVG